MIPELFGRIEFWRVGRQLLDLEPPMETGKNQGLKGREPIFQPEPFAEL
jgi:hypothetical protein